ncbi:MAG: heparinase II/III family protein [Phycisphaerae bacterium]
MRRGILATVDELKALADNIDRRPFDVIYDTLRKRCSLILEAQPITETHWRSMWQSGAWLAATQAARTAQGRMLDLLIAHRIERNDAYRSRAVEELKNVIHWSTWVDPSHPRVAADLCTAEAAVAVVLALDWLWDDLDSDTREAALASVRTKAIAPYLQAVREGAWWYGCYHSWNAVVNGGMALVAAAMNDQDPDAAEALPLAKAGLSHFFDGLGPEGGWDEGTGFWGFAMRYVLLAAEALRRLDDDQTLLHQRGMEQTGLFGVYFTPNGQAASFGEKPVVPLYGTLYLLAEHYDCPQVLWWLDTYAFHNDVGTSGYSAAGLALLFRPDDAPLVKEPELENVQVFHAIGWGAMADHWPRPTVYVAAKTGDLSANHSQRDMNSIQLHVGGEPLLVDLGGGNSHYAETGEDLELVQARSHNTLTVAEADHQIDAQGRIIDEGQDTHYRWLACDAGEALGEGVSFVRHAVIVTDPRTGDGRALLTLDRVQLVMPEKVEMFWHAGGPITADGDGLCGAISGRRSRLNYRIAGTMNISAEIEENPVGRGRTDHVIHATAGVMGQAYLLSVFALDSLDGETRVTETPEGVEVQAGPYDLTFHRDGRHLRLQQVNIAGE